MAQLKTFFSFLGSHKWKFVLMIFSTVVFVILLFPFGDLADLITAQVSKMTGNQVYLQFDDMRMSAFPQPGVAFDQVYVQGSSFPALKAQELVFTPSIMSLISQKPAGNVLARGFLKGQIKASISPGAKSESGVERQKMTLKAEQLSLAELKTLLNLPVSLKGNLNIDTSALADLTFREQPDMDLIVKIDRFELPPSNVQTMMGPLTLPDLKLSAVELKGRLSAGRFIIEEGIIGRATDEINGTVKGNLGLEIQNRGNGFAPVIGGYNFDIDLKIKKSFEQKGSLFLSFIDQYKTALPDGSRYAFKLSAANPMMPPSFGALR